MVGNGPRDPDQTPEENAGAFRFSLLPRAPLLTALLLFVTGLWIHLRFYPIGNLGVETDFYGDLAVAARKLVEGRFSVLDYPHKGPLYPLLLAGFHVLFPDWYRAGVVLNLLCACGSVLLIHRICRRLFTPEVALWTMIFTATNYVFFVDAHKATSDHLFLVLGLGSIEALTREQRPGGRRPRDLVLSGFLASLAFLTRYNGAFLVFGAAIVLLLVEPSGRRMKDRLRPLLLWLAAFLVPCLPWFAISLAGSGRLLYNQNLGNISREFLTDPRFPDRPPEEIRSFSQLIFRDPAGFVLHYLANIPRHLWLDLRWLLNPFTGVVAFGGLVVWLLRRPPRRQVAFVVFPAVYAASMALVFYLPRFRVLVGVAELALAFLLIFRLGGARVRPRWRHLACAILLVPQIVITTRTERVNAADRPLYYLKAAEFLRARETDPRDARLLALKPHLAFLSGMTWQGYPWEVGSTNDLLRHIRETRVAYVCLGRLEAARVPGVEAFLDADSLPGLRRIYRAPELSLYSVAAGVDSSLAQGLEEEIAARVDRAQALAGDGRWREAEAELRAAMDRGTALPPSVEGRSLLRAVRGNLALVLLQTGNSAAAVPLLEESLRELEAGASSAEGNAELARTLSLLAAHEEKLGRTAEARAHLEQGLRIYEQLGDREGAAEARARLGAMSR